jgi:hypothetical protein
VYSSCFHGRHFHTRPKFTFLHGNHECDRICTFYNNSFSSQTFTTSFEYLAFAARINSTVFLGARRDLPGVGVSQAD